MNKTSVISSLALGSLLAMGSAQAANPFAAKTMANAHQNQAKADEAKCGDAKCGATTKKPLLKVQTPSVAKANAVQPLKKWLKKPMPNVVKASAVVANNPSYL